MDLLERFRWRYAAKRMDPARAVPDEVVERIIEAARLAPTSSGLQPFEIVLVTNAEVRGRIQAAAHRQAQVTEGSHLLVFAAWDDYTPARINEMFDLVNEVRGVRNEGWEAYRQRLLADYPARGRAVNFHHAALQAYIGLGFALAAAAVEGIDCTPMEGFEPEAVDAILGLPARGLRSVVLLPLGYRDADSDWLVKLPKVRRPRERFVTEVR